MYKVIDNVLPRHEFNYIKNLMMSVDFSWNLNLSVTDSIKNEPITNTASYYFTHTFWDKFHTTPDAMMFANLLNSLGVKAISRIKGNCYPSTDKLIHHKNHVDYEFPHRAAILYINSNDGLTILEDEIEIESVENRLLVFDASRIHRSTTCTNAPCRINVNFNFF